MTRFSSKSFRKTLKNRKNRKARKNRKTLQRKRTRGGGSTLASNIELENESVKIGKIDLDDYRGDDATI